MYTLSHTQIHTPKTSNKNLNIGSPVYYQFAPTVNPFKSGSRDYSNSYTQLTPYQQWTSKTNGLQVHYYDTMVKVGRYPVLV